MAQMQARKTEVEAQNKCLKQKVDDLEARLAVLEHQRTDSMEARVRALRQQMPAAPVSLRNCLPVSHDVMLMPTSCPIGLMRCSCEAVELRV